MRVGDGDNRSPDDQEQEYSASRFVIHYDYDGE